jgi:hypothetical protein
MGCGQTHNRQCKVGELLRRALEVRRPWTFTRLRANGKGMEQLPTFIKAALLSGHHCGGSCGTCNWIVNLLSRARDQSTFMGVWFTLCGLVAVGQMFAVFYFPASRVKLTSDGTFTFASPRRQLEVKPGDLISVKKLWIFDRGRLLPLWLKSQNGRILLSSRIEDRDALRDALLQYSPYARVCQLTSGFSRAITGGEDPGITWDQ